MSKEIISGFNVSKSEPLDVKETVVNTAARLALIYPYKGLLVRELDTLQIYKYKTTTPVDGSIPSNVSGDWELVIEIRSGSGVPATGLGAIGDVYIDETGFVLYKKTGAATWTSMFTVSGSAILTGVAVASGGNDGDMYVRSNGDVSTKISGVWTLQFNIKGTDGQSDIYATTSVTSVNVGTIVAPMTITVGLGLSYTVGQTVIVASRANNANKVEGSVSSYDVVTGILILSPITPAGAGTFTDWDVNLSGAPGLIGKAFIHTEANINLNSAKVTAVEAGVWTRANPWSASIANDTRASLVVPVQISGNKTNHSIAYDGTDWFDNGVWRGTNGTNGINGTNGTNGSNGSNGLISFGTIASPATIQNQVKGWYFIDLLTSQNVVLGGNNEVGTIITICRTLGSVDGNVPLDSEYTALITSNVAASLNYKGRYVTSIPTSARNITFAVFSNVAGVSYWKCVGEDASFLEAVKASQAPIFNLNGNLLLQASSVSSKIYAASTFTANRYSVPRIAYRIDLFKGTGDSIVVARIGHSADNVAWNVLKQTTFAVRTNNLLYLTIEAIDNSLGDGITNFYRLELSSPSTFQPSNVEDKMIHGVLRY